MYKYIIILMLLFVTGCENKEKNIYDNYINELKNVDTNSEYIPFDISISYEKLIDEEVTYRVIIDNPKEEIRNIETIVIHDYKTDDIFPSSGIFDEKYNLIPNVIDKDSNDIKGIILTGYIPFDKDINEFDAEFKVLIKYTDSKGIINKIYYSLNSDSIN